MSFFTKQSFTSTSIFLLVGILFGLVSATQYTLAAPNPEINYQGKLTSSANVAVADGTYQMVFSLYATSTGGSAIWTETRSGADEVAVTNGLFSVLLGSVTALSGVDFNQPLYLGVTVDTDSEMTPRKKLGTVPAAFEAFNASTVGGVSSTSLVRNDRINSIATSSASTLLTITQNGAGKVLDLFSSASNVFSVLNNGNVGIGSSTPGSRLVVAGNTFLGGNVTATGTLAISGTSTLANTSVTSLAVGSLSGLLFGTGGSVSAVATSSLGIAIADTTGILAATRGGTGLGTITQNQLLIGGAGNTWTQIATSSLGFSSSFTTSAQLAALLSDETGSAGGGLAVFSNGPTFTGTSNFVNTANSGTLSVTGTSTFAGNVGIGTSTPSSRLTLSGTGTTSGLNINNTATIYSLSGTELAFNFGGIDRWKMESGRFYTESGTGPSLNGSTGISILPRYADLTTGLMWVGTGILGLRAGSSTADAVTINNSNVGIGTTTPGAKLDVWGNFRVGTGTTPNLFANTASNFVGVGTSTKYGTEVLGIGGDVLLNDFALLNDAASSTFVKFVSGRLVYTGLSGAGVGVRIINSAVANGSSAELDFNSGSVNASRISSVVDSTDNHSLRFFTRGAAVLNEVMRISPTGNVGIGTTTPGSRLTVAGTGFFGGSLTATGTLAIFGTSTLATTTATNLSLAQALAATSGGTGLSTITQNQLLIGGAGNTWTQIATSSLGFSSSFTTSAGLAALLSNETGSAGGGLAVFSNGPTFTGLASFASTTASQGYFIGSTPVMTGSTTARNFFMAGASSTSFTSAVDNNSFGLNALANLGTGDYNFAVGLSALRGSSTALMSGSHNNALGELALRNNISGSFNNAFGSEILFFNTTGSDNNVMGKFAMYQNTSGSNNNVFGRDALSSNITGSHNNAFGQAALDNNNGTGTIGIGYQAANNALTVDRGIFIGYNIEAASTTQDDVLNIGNLIFGNDVNGTGTALSSGNIGIGTSTPFAKFSVAQSVANSGIAITGAGAAATNTGAMFITSAGVFAIQAGGVGIGALAGANGQTAAGWSDGAFTMLNNKELGFGDVLDYSAGYNSGDDTFRIVDGTDVSVGTSTRFAITNTGNIGIGTTTPGSRLTVAGTFLATGTSTLATTTITNLTLAQALGATSGGTGLSSYATGDLIYASGANTLAKRAIGTNGQVLQVVGGLPTWVATSSLGITGGGGGTSFLALSDTPDAFNAGRIFYTNSSSDALVDSANFTFDGSRLSVPNLLVTSTSTFSGTTTLATTTINGLVQIGTTSIASRFNLDVGGFNTTGTAGLNRYYTSTNAASGTVQFGELAYSRLSTTATTTYVGSMFRVEDSTTQGNTVRGLEVQTNRGTNTQGENTALSGFARTFGVRGFTSADAGSVFEPAGGYFETGGTTQGNAIRGYSSTITSAALSSLFQDTSAFSGTGFLMNLGNGTGSFTGNFMDLQVAGISKFSIASTGTAILAGNLLPQTTLNQDIGSSSKRFNNIWAQTVNVGTSTWSIFNGSNGRFAVSDGGEQTGTERFSILTNGNTGIGTTSPVTRLHVYGTGSGLPANTGTAVASGTLSRIETGSSNGVIDFGVAGANTATWIQSSQKTNLANPWRLLLNPNGGDVGIGTSTPGSRLTIVDSDVTNAVLSVVASAGTDATANGKLLELIASEGGGFSFVDSATVGFLPNILLESDEINGLGGAITGAIPISEDVFSSTGAGVTIIGRRSDSTQLTQSNLLTVRNLSTPVVTISATGTIAQNVIGSLYDVWIQGGAADATGGDARNIALIGNASTDDLILNFNDEYDCVSVGGTACTESLTVSGGASFTSPVFINTTSNNPAAANVAGTYLSSSGFISANRLAAASTSETMSLGRDTDGQIIGFYGAGNEEGAIGVYGTTIAYNAFTGSHYGLTGGVVYDIGTLLDLTGVNGNTRNNPEAEILYGMTKSTIENSSTIIGSYLSLSEPLSPESIANPTLVMSVGNGAMWVADQGEDIVRGDYLISSDVAGHAEKDTKSYDVSYVIARASEDIDWSDVSTEINGVKHKRITVFFESFDRPNIDLALLASSTINLAELSNETPTKRFLAGLVDSLVTWFGDAQNGIGSMYANVFNASERICVDGECLDASDIRDLKNALQNGGSSNPPPQNSGDGGGGTEGEGGSGETGDGSGTGGTGDAGGTGSGDTSGGSGTGGDEGSGTGGADDTPPAPPPPSDGAGDSGGASEPPPPSGG